MSQLVLEIPYDIANALKLPPAEQLMRIRQELAIRLYQKQLLSFGRARELAQATKWEFHWILGQEGVVRSYDLEELESDLDTLELLA